MSKAVAKRDDGLEPRQERFCQEYVKDLNGTQAAIRAGYSAKTANEQASRMLANVNVAARVAELQQTVAEKAGVTALGLLTELRRVAYGDMRNFFNDKGQLLPIPELSDDAAAMLASIEVERRTEGHGDDAEVYHVHKVKRWDKLKAVEMLMKHMNLLNDRTEHVGKGGGPVIVEIKRFSEEGE